MTSDGRKEEGGGSAKSDFISKGVLIKSDDEVGVKKGKIHLTSYMDGP